MLKILPVDYDIQIKREESSKDIKDLMFSIFELKELGDKDRKEIKVLGNVVGQHLFVEVGGLLKLKLSKVPHEVLEFILKEKNTIFLEVTDTGSHLFEASVS